MEGQRTTSHTVNTGVSSQSTPAAPIVIHAEDCSASDSNSNSNRSQSSMEEATTTTPNLTPSYNRKQSSAGSTGSRPFYVNDPDFHPNDGGGRPSKKKGIIVTIVSLLVLGATIGLASLMVGSQNDNESSSSNNNSTGEGVESSTSKPSSKAISTSNNICPELSATTSRFQFLDGGDLILYYAIIQKNTTSSTSSSSLTGETSITTEQQKKDSNSILCIRMESELQGYIGFGISPNGTMSGAEAIIGIPSDGTVFKYNLQGGDGRSVSVMESAKQTLLHARVTTTQQYNNENDGKTVMEFAKYLMEGEDEHEILLDSGGLNSFLYAVGLDGGELGYHARKGSFFLDLS